MALPTNEEVREVIRERVKDPELMMNIVDLGLIYDVDITPEKTVEITMTLTSPGCPAGPEIITNVQRETHSAFPDVEEVNIHLTWSPFWNPGHDVGRCQGRAGDFLALRERRLKVRVPGPVSMGFAHTGPVLFGGPVHIWHNQAMNLFALAGGEL